MKRIWLRFEGCDWTQFPQILLLVIIYLISRIPFLNLGFGTDPDAWRIANTAFDLNHFFIYHTSRFPGYPLPEYVNSIIINYGWVATNTITMFLSLISVLVFAKILKELEVKNKGLIVITYAFLSLVWIHSVNTMDYMWAVTFIIICWYFLIEKKYILAGLMMGLAIGSRPTSAILLIPFIYLILTESDIKKVLCYLITTLAAVIVLFSPLFAQYGFGFFSLYPPFTDLNTVLNDIIYSFGILSIIIFALLMVFSYKNGYKTLRKDNNMVFALFVVLIVLVFFVASPYETAYLLPAIPFALVFISKFARKKLVVILCYFLILNSFISVNLTLEPSEVIEKGVVIEDWDVRAILTDTLHKISNTKFNNTVIITGEYYPMLRYLSRISLVNPSINKIEIDPKEIIVSYWDVENNQGYVYLARADDMLKWQNKGYKIYYMGQSTITLTKIYYKYDLEGYNCINLFESINEFNKIKSTNMIWRDTTVLTI